MVSVEMRVSSVLTKVSHQRVDSSLTGIKAVFCVRNEKFRLPYFLEYYRKLGVNEFFAIDNNSDDDTQSYLLEQPDVHVFHTEASYKESNAGRDWTSEIANRYCDGCWCLTLDVDEYLIYPFCEQVDLNLFTQYLEKWGYEGLFSVFLDFYSRTALSQTTYEQGDSPFDVCSYFDTAQSYNVFETSNFPFLQIKGGIRQRKFWDSNDVRSGPSMRKLVLVKWQSGFEYLHSTHSCTAIRLADITGVLAHFKFLSHFREYSKAEVARNERVANSADWKVYSEALEKDDINFFDERLSVKYLSSKTLMDDGHLNCSLRFFDYVFSSSVSRECDGFINRRSQTRVRDDLVQKNQISSISYRELNKIWPSIGLFSQTFGSNTKGVQDLFRIDEEVDNLINSRSWRATRKLRNFGQKIGACDQRSFPEDMHNQSIYSKFVYTYNSVWWDISAPFRLVVKVIRKFTS